MHPTDSLDLAPGPLSEGDAGELLTLQRAAYVTEAQLHNDPFLPALTQTLEELTAELVHPVLGVWSGTRLVGSARWIVKDSIAHIGRIIVAPDLQGRGIGTALLRATEAESKADHFELFTGHRSEANLRLYKREGYVFHRREVLRPDVELVYLTKSR